MSKPVNYERFGDRTRKVFQMANQEARNQNHEQIYPVHILLALMKDRSNGIAAAALKFKHVTLEAMQRECEKHFPSGPEILTMGKLAQTEETKRITLRAIEEADLLGDEEIDTEHLLSALIHCEERNLSAAGKTLIGLGVNFEVCETR